MARSDSNPSKSDIAPEPPNMAPPSPPSPPSTSGQNAPPPHADLPPVLNPGAATPGFGTPPLGAPSSLGTMRGDSLREQALREDALRSEAAVPPAVRPRTLSELAAVPAGPREIPVQPGDPKQIRPKQVMGGLDFVNDRVEPGTTTLTPDHANPAATAEQRRASLIKTVEEADIAARRREHAEMRPRVEEELARRDASGEPLTR